MAHLIIGSYASKLAQARSQWVKAQLERLHPGLVVGVETFAVGAHLAAENGWRATAASELEQALLERRIDCVVQSLSDIPPFLPDPLHIAVVPERADAREALVLSRALPPGLGSLFGLPPRARVGVSNLCRAAQLFHCRPELQPVLLAGDSEACLAQLDAGACEAFLIGLPEWRQSGYADRAALLLSFAEVLPAAGQGAAGLVTRVDDQRTNLLLETLNHWPTRYAAEAERSVLRHLGGGAHAAVAALGSFISLERGQQLTLTAVVADVVNKRVYRREVSGAPLRYEGLGGLLAQQLSAAGAGEWLSKAAALLPTEIAQLYPARQPLAVAAEAVAAPATIAEVGVQNGAEISAEIVVATSAEIGAETGAENVCEAVAAPAFSSARVSGRASVLPPLLLPPMPMLIDASLLTPEPVAEPDLPLTGCRVVITQTIWSNNELEHALAALGARVSNCPAVEVREPLDWSQLDRALLHLSWYDWVVFLSHHAADYFLRRFEALGHPRAELLARRILAVGRSTAERLESDGVQPDLVLEQLTEASFSAAQRRFGARRGVGRSTLLLPAARALGEVLRPTLDQLGVYVEIVETYQTIFPKFAGQEVLELLRQAEADYLIFQGAATVTGLVSQLRADTSPGLDEHTRLVCLGEATAEEARALGLHVYWQPQDFNALAVAELLTEDWLKRREEISRAQPEAEAFSLERPSETPGLETGLTN